MEFPPSMAYAFSTASTSTQAQLDLLRAATHFDDNASWTRAFDNDNDVASPKPLKKKRKSLPQTAVKGQWSDEEDQLLCALVRRLGDHSWAFIAAQFGGRRVGKQCRERWVNHLDPAIRLTEWTSYEESLVYAGVRRFGPRWSKISFFLPGRSDNHVKNHWYCHMKKYLDETSDKLLRDYQQSLLALMEELRLDEYFEREQPVPLELLCVDDSADQVSRSNKTSGASSMIASPAGGGSSGVVVVDDVPASASSTIVSVTVDLDDQLLDVLVDVSSLLESTRENLREDSAVSASLAGSGSIAAVASLSDYDDELVLSPSSSRF